MPLFEYGFEKNERRKHEFDKYVDRFPELKGKGPDDYNRGLKHYIQTGELPTSYETGRELRVESGQKEETPLPGGGVSVQFPTTNVSPETRPIQFGERLGLIDPRDPGQVIFPKGSEDATRLQLLPYGAIGARQEAKQGATVPAGQEEEVEVRDIGGGLKGIFVGGVLKRSLTPQQMRTGTGGGGGGGRGATAQQQADKQILGVWLRAIAPKYDFTGQPIVPVIDDELTQMAAEAARRLNVALPQPEAAIQEPPPANPTPGVPGSTPSYKSPDDVKAAYRSGKITQEQALAILQQQFQME